MEPVLAKAARKLGVDQVAIRRMNAPEGKAPFGPLVAGKQQYATSAFIKEALDRGSEQFKWNERKVNTGKRNGSKVRGVGVSISCYSGGTTGFDGLFVIKPDGRVYIQSGVGNLGTESWTDVHRVVAELLGVPWEKCDITWGNTSKNLPWTCPSGGSQTTHAMTRAAHAVAIDAIAEAAADCRQRPRRQARGLRGCQRTRLPQRRRRRHDAGPSRSARDPAGRRIRWPRTASGHKQIYGGIRHGAGRPGLAGRGEGQVSARRQHFFLRRHVCRNRSRRRNRPVPHFGFPGLRRRRAPCSIRERSAARFSGVRSLGIGHAIGQKWVYDQHYGLAVSRRFHHTKPPTILDIPDKMAWAAVEIPDPETPIGSRGIGEPPVGGGCAAILNALSDALGDEVFRRAPVTSDVILASLEAGRPAQDPLRSNI